MIADRNGVGWQQAALPTRCDSLLVAKRVWDTSGSPCTPG